MHLFLLRFSARKWEQTPSSPHPSSQGVTECRNAFSGILVAPKKYSCTLLEEPESHEDDVELSPEITNIQNKVFPRLLHFLFLGNDSDPQDPVKCVLFIMIS